MTIKIGLLGCGVIAGSHAGGYLKVPEARVTAVCDVIPENAVRMAEYVGGAQVFADFDTLIAQADIDAVDICLPHHLHEPAIRAAAAAGKHILCEKPLCTTLAEADAIRVALAASGVTLMCAHNQIFNPGVQRAKELLAAGAIGQVYELRTMDMFRHGYGTDATKWAWRSKKSTMGGGELIDTGYHPSYLLLYLAEAAPTAVTAMLSNYYAHVLEGEDSAQVLVRFGDGAVGNIVTSWAYEFPAGSWPFHIIGAEGQIYGGNNHVSLKLNGAEPEHTEFAEASTFDVEVADFVACLVEGRQPLQGVEDGIRVLQVILAAYQSAAEGRVVSLDAL